MRGKRHSNVFDYSIIILSIILPLLIFLSMSSPLLTGSVPRALSMAASTIGPTANQTVSGIIAQVIHQPTSPQPIFSAQGDPPTPPQGVRFYAPITIYAPGSSDHLFSGPMLLKIPVSTFDNYIASNFQNVEFYDSSGRLIYSWYQDIQSGGSVPGSGFYEVWVKDPNADSAPSTATIYIGIGDKSVRLLNGVYSGEAPQLSSGWAAYDNGASVFEQYVSNNWASYFTFSSQWSSDTTHGYLSQTNNDLVGGQLVTGPKEDDGAAAIKNIYGTQVGANGTTDQSYVVDMMFTHPSTVPSNSRLGLITLGHTKSRSVSGGTDIAIYGYRFLLGGQVDSTPSCPAPGVVVGLSAGKNSTQSANLQSLNPAQFDSGCTYTNATAISFLNDHGSGGWISTRRTQGGPTNVTPGDTPLIMSLDVMYASPGAKLGGSGEYSSYVAREDNGQVLATYPSASSISTSYSTNNFTEYHASSHKFFNGSTNGGSKKGYVGISATGPYDTDSQKMNVYWFRVRKPMPYGITMTFGSLVEFTTTSIPLCSSSPCYIANTINATTNLNGAGAGSITQNPNKPSSSVPLIQKILNKNSANVQWLLTCPSAPNPTYPLEYLTNTIYNILGNRCLANSESLKSDASFKASITWSNTAPAHATTSFVLANVTRGVVQNLAYSGATNTTGNYNFSISGGYDTKSYIFNQVPAATQQGIWTWHAEYADLSHFDINGFTLPFQQYLDLKISKSATISSPAPTCTDPQIPCAIGGRQPVCLSLRACSGEGGHIATSSSTTYSWTCDYPYNYSYETSMETFYNTTIPTPLSSTPVSTGGSLTFTYQNGTQKTFPFHEVTATGQGKKPGTIPVGTSVSDYVGCFQALLNPSNPNTGAYELTAPSGPCGEVYSYVSSTASLVTSSGNIYPCSSSIDPLFGCMGNEASAPPALFVWQDPTNSGKYWIVYKGHYDNKLLGGEHCSSYSDYSYCNTGNSDTTLNVYWAGYVLKSQGQVTSTARLRALPYLLYNVSLPVSVGASSGSSQNFMNLSLDIYSAKNLEDPTSLDGVPLNTGSAILASYGNLAASFPSSLLSLSNPSPSSFSNPTLRFVSSLSNSSTSANWVFGPGGSDTQSNLGTYATGAIPTPAAIVASPTDNIYMLTKSIGVYQGYHEPGFNVGTLPDGPLVLSLRFIPAGYYNISNYQPNILGSGGITSWNTWNASWMDYWSNTIQQQSASLYLTNVYNLQTLVSQPSGISIGGLGADPKGLAMAVTPNGDMIIATTTSNSRANFKFVDLNSAGKVLGASDVSSPSGFVPSSIAADPGGQYVYAVNSMLGQIAIYSVPGFTYQGGIPLTYSVAGTPINIYNYMLNGGPFSNQTMRSDVGGTGYLSSEPQSYEDSSSNHHPIAISEYSGFLYVLDDWAFNVPYGASDNPSMGGDMLSLRVFSANGTEIPVNGYPKSTTPSTYQVASGSGSVPPGGWPPYGWILSANFTFNNVLHNPGSHTYASYCLMGCNATSDVPQGAPYLPIGPAIYLPSQVSHIGNTFQNLDYSAVGMSVDFNGTVYLLLRSLNKGHSGKYTELIRTTFNILNYTTISNGANSAYTCYVNASSVGALSPKFPCNDATSYDSAMRSLHPPLVGVPSSFEYLESQGATAGAISPSNLFPQYTLQGGASSGGSGSTTTSTIATSTISYGNVYSSSTSSSSASNNEGLMYANSIIQGYVLLPYYISYGTTQSWKTHGNPYVYSGTTPPSYSTAEACPAYPFPSDTQSAVNGYFTAQTNIKSNYLNDTIEGGQMYAQYQTSGNLYVANVSDKNLIMLPRIAYSVLSNRMFGEVYINRTLDTQDAINGLENPLVVNAVSLYSYKEHDFNQSAFGKTFPGFSLQEAVPLSSVDSGVAGAACGVSGCPSNYYYSGDSANYLQEPSAMNYTRYQKTNYLQLIDAYKQASMADSLVLDMNQSNSQGYNRLIFTYVDRFNNTISMPLDVDFANTVTLDMAANVAVNPMNSNQTSITINGIAYSHTTTSYAPLANSYVYLYYDSNLNYYNSTTTPTSDINGYTTYALQCAFAPSSTACELANPLATLTQSSAGYVTEANRTSYAPQYNSTRTPGTCAPQSKSLLLTPNFTECNIYNEEGLSSTRFVNGHREYCVPYFLNGTGSFTSQLGLVKIIETNSTGAFSYAFDACGTGQETLMVQYYGYPPPQPFIATQTALDEASSLEFSNMPLAARTKYPMQEYSYTVGPATIQIPVIVGNYALSFGDVSVYTLGIATSLLALALLLNKKRTHTSKNKLSESRKSVTKNKKGK